MAIDKTSFPEKGLGVEARLEWLKDFPGDEK
jgi:hypothetical protein